MESAALCLRDFWNEGLPVFLNGADIRCRYDVGNACKPDEHENMWCCGGNIDDAVYITITGLLLDVANVEHSFISTLDFREWKDNVNKN